MTEKINYTDIYILSPEEVEDMYFNKVSKLEKRTLDIHFALSPKSSNKIIEDLIKNDFFFKEGVIFNSSLSENTANFIVADLLQRELSELMRHNLLDAIVISPSFLKLKSDLIIKICSEFKVDKETIDKLFKLKQGDELKILFKNLNLFS